MIANISMFLWNTTKYSISTIISYVLLNNKVNLKGQKKGAFLCRGYSSVQRCGLEVDQLFRLTVACELVQACPVVRLIQKVSE